MTTSETSASLRAQAAEIRDQAAQLHAEEQAVLASGHAEADRLRAEADRVFAEARDKANRLANEANQVERSADPVEERALMLQAAEELAETIPTAETRIVTLIREAEELGVTIDGLTERLTQLGVDREEVGVHLAAAREAGDVDQVTQLRIRLGAIDEVVQALTGQRRSAVQRVIAIGEPDADGELAKAARLLVQLRDKQRQTLNWLDPERFEAKADALFTEFAECVNAQYGRLQEQQAQKQLGHRSNTIVQK